MACLQTCIGPLASLLEFRSQSLLYFCLFFLQQRLVFPLSRRTLALLLIALILLQTISTLLLIIVKHRSFATIQQTKFLLLTFQKVLLQPSWPYYSLTEQSRIPDLLLQLLQEACPYFPSHSLDQLYLQDKLINLDDITEMEDDTIFKLEEL